MAIPKSSIGTRLTSITATIERGRLAFFASAIGETDLIYSDIEAARAAGLPDLLVPPTFLFGMLLEVPEPHAWMTALGIDMRYLLHGNQAFTYHAAAYAGETLTLEPTITDVFDKKGGALEFLSRQTEVTRQNGERVATLTETLIVRHPDLEKAR